MKNKIFQFIIILSIFSLTITACKKDKGESNEEELITTLLVHLSSSGGGPVLEYEFKDLDGPGGDDATQDVILLQPNTTYFVSLALLNESVDPAEDITEEIEEENLAHRFYFEPAAGSTITVSDLNTDGNGMPLGTTSTWTTGDAGTSSIKITLRHYPGNPPDKQTTDPSNSPKSSTDISVDFATTVN